MLTLMPSTSELATNAYGQSAREQLQLRLDESPEWLQDIRLKALSRFEVLGFPTRKLEAWKYINLRPFLSLPLHPSDIADPLVCPPALQRHLLDARLDTSDADHAGASQVLRLVFVNGRFSETLSQTEAPGNGIVVSSLKSACQNHPELVRQSLGQMIETENDAFSALNTALFEDGAFIYLPDHAELTPLLQLVYVNVGEDNHAAYPHNLVVLGQKTKLSLVIDHIGLADAVSFDASVNHFHLGEGAQADCTVVLSEGPQGWHLANTRSHLQTNASLALNTVSLSGDVNRHSVQTLLQGEGAHVTLNGLDVLDDKTQTYHHTVTEHWVPNCTSDQVYKSILDDASLSEFNSMVFVAKGANGTDSHQLNRGLLLSEDAKIYTRPQLQINADDVKCAHGAAVGQLNEDQLFYLASRGLEPEVAQALLTYGFAEDVITRIAHPLVRRYLDGRILNNLRRAGDTVKKQLANTQLGV